LRLWAPLSLDATPVAVVWIGPEEIADGPYDSDGGYESEADDEGDGGSCDCWAVTAGPSQKPRFKVIDGRHSECTLFS